jgi:hypothetical protein
MPTKARTKEFAICLSASAEEDLVVGKVYQILPDPSAAAVGCLRVVDESGEDYLYPTGRFVLVSIPLREQRRLLKAVRKRPA